ncbi:hypothetical protein [Nonomuraea dietziae]
MSMGSPLSMALESHPRGEPYPTLDLAAALLHVRTDPATGEI